MVPATDDGRGTGRWFRPLAPRGRFAWYFGVVAVGIALAGFAEVGVDPMLALLVFNPGYWLLNLALFGLWFIGCPILIRRPIALVPSLLLGLVLTSLLVWSIEVDGSSTAGINLLALPVIGVGVMGVGLVVEQVFLEPR